MSGSTGARLISDRLNAASGRLLEGDIRASPTATLVKLP
jgi:hypothetical protein